MSKSRLVRWFLIGTGGLALLVGAVGVVVPLLPTTPFLLLAAACFVRGSDRLYVWLIHHRWLGGYIRNYREHRAMTLRAKVIALLLLWTVIGHSAVMAADRWWIRLLLVAIALGVTLHLLLLKTAARSMPRPLQAGGEPERNDPDGMGQDDGSRQDAEARR